jgi:hypothetical protein
VSDLILLSNYYVGTCLNRFLTVSGPAEGLTEGVLIVRTLPEGDHVWTANFTLLNYFKPAVMTSDNENIVICSQEDNAAAPKSR